MEIIKDYSIAKFLVNQAAKQDRLIYIETDRQLKLYDSSITPERLTEIFLEMEKNSKSITIGLR